MNPLVEPIPAGACDIETYPGENAEKRIAAGEFAPEGRTVKVLNPRGTPPAVKLRPMAPRPASLEGRTVYLVDVRFMNGAVFLGEIQKLFAERFPGVTAEFRQKRGGYTEDDPELWAEIKAKNALVVMAIGHCSTCAPAVAVHCARLEDMGIPTAPLVTSAFVDLVKAVTRKAGMPELRFTFVPHPVGGKTPAELREVGKDALGGIAAALTRPLGAEETRTGAMAREVPRLLGADSEEALHALFLEAGWTDGLPVVLPTEARVAAMLKGTSHRPDEVVGKMRPTETQEDWTYTVEQVAVNAVLAGARPDCLPVILALAASEVTALHSSTSSFAAMAVVNGPIRHEIRMNSGLGALGPFNHANATIGRAWGLLSRNLGGGAVPGITYLGSQGNPLNYANTCFAENEERSPWEPFHVQKGFQTSESVVSVFRGRSYTHLLEVREKTWREQFKSLVGGFTPTPRTNLTLILEPIAARALASREGFDTKRKLQQWFHDNVTLPYEVYWDHQLVINYIEPQARKGVEPYASYLNQPKDSLVPRFGEPEKIGVVVAGGEKNAYWYATDFGWLRSEPVDRWR
jgi:hypothetical protein